MAAAVHDKLEACKRPTYEEAKRLIDAGSMT